MVAAIESECWPDSNRNGGRFPAGTVAGFVRNTQQDILDTFKATGKGWQTRVNEALREWLKTHNPA